MSHISCSFVSSDPCAFNDAPQSCFRTKYMSAIIFSYFGSLIYLTAASFVPPSDFPACFWHVKKSIRGKGGD